MPYTVNKKLSIQAFNTNNNTWGAGGTAGDDLNTGVIGSLDSMIAGIATFTLSNANVSLTFTPGGSGNVQQCLFRFTGILTGNVVVSPAAGDATTYFNGFFFFENLTTGNFTVTLSTAAGSVVLPQGNRGVLFIDATNGPRIIANPIVSGTIAFGPFTSIASAATTDLSTLTTVGANITGTTTITSLGTGANQLRIVKFAGSLTLTYNATSLILPTSANIVTVAGDTAIFLSDGSGNQTCVVYQRRSGAPIGAPVPTVQRFTSGSGNYVPTAGTINIRVRMCGGGGGGGAEQTNNGTNGGDTAFGSWTAIHGNGGPHGSNSAPVAGGAGGTGGTNGTGNLIVRIAGGAGMGISQVNINWLIGGGYGGANPFGGAGAPIAASTGGAGAPNTGAGGAGGGVNNAQDNPGNGGGAGEYVEFWVANPGTIAYAVGGGGTGGAAGLQAGGNGAAGIIIVEEFYS